MNPKEAFMEMVRKTKHYLYKNKLETMVLGISGGIDSTVVAFICAEVAAQTNYEKNFMFLSLPSSTNSNGETLIARKIIDELTCEKKENKEIKIEEYYRNVASINGDLTDMDPICLGNIKARLRMMILYNFAYLNKGIVMDTDNLTEHYTGFFTVHGDVGDLSPMGGSLWKTDVYDVAEWLRKEAQSYESDLVLFECASDEERAEYAKILKHSIDLFPTDGNGTSKGGCDMDQLAPGYTYKEVDAVLKMYIKCKEIRNEFGIKDVYKTGGKYHFIYNDGKEEDVSSNIVNMFNSNEKMKSILFDYKEIANEYFGGNETIVVNLINRVERTQFKREKSPVRFILENV